MAYPATLLINRAWYLSGIVARGLMTVSGEQGADGLYLLNELLDYKSVNLPLIPYWKRTQLQLITGQEKYFIPDLYDIQTFTFNIGVVRYPVNNCPREKYFGNGRVDNIDALPYIWHLEREFGGSNLYVYYLPMQDYLADITGKYALTNVTMNTDLSTVYDGFYIAYLRYALANYMCMEYDIDFAPAKKEQLRKYELQLANLSPPDLTMNKTPFLNSGTPLNWAHINISPGWDV